MKTLIAAFFLSVLVAKAAPIAPESVAVVYNSNIPESVDLAAHYAQMRNIPAQNLIGIPLPERG